MSADMENSLNNVNGGKKYSEAEYCAHLLDMVSNLVLFI